MLVNTNTSTNMILLLFNQDQANNKRILCKDEILSLILLDR